MFPSTVILLYVLWECVRGVIPLFLSYPFASLTISAGSIRAMRCRVSAAFSSKRGSACDSKAQPGELESPQGQGGVVFFSLEDFHVGKNLLQMRQSQLARLTFTSSWARARRQWSLSFRDEPLPSRFWIRSTASMSLPPRYKPLCLFHFADRSPLCTGNDLAIGYQGSLGGSITITSQLSIGVYPGRQRGCRQRRRDLQGRGAAAGEKRSRGHGFAGSGKAVAETGESIVTVSWFRSSQKMNWLSLASAALSSASPSPCFASSWSMVCTWSPEQESESGLFAAGGKATTGIQAATRRSRYGKGFAGSCCSS